MKCSIIIIQRSLLELTTFQTIFGVSQPFRFIETVLCIRFHALNLNFCPPKKKVACYIPCILCNTLVRHKRMRLLKYSIADINTNTGLFVWKRKIRPDYDFKRSTSSRLRVIRWKWKKEKHATDFNLLSKMKCHKIFSVTEYKSNKKLLFLILNNSYCFELPPS